MSWVTIRDGAKGLVDNISGLIVTDVMPDVLPNKDHAVVVPSDPLIEPSGHHGVTDIYFRVVIRCQRATAKDAQDALDAYLWPTGASSIVAAIEADPTLSGTVDDVQFLRVQNYGIAEGTQGAFQADVSFKAKVAA